jgi:3-phenylpropionate/trans-cinnamate dioxygenase ferredoxin reductase component
MTSTAAAGMVIVGAGESGARASAALREQGYRGSVTLIGAERHAPYERPPLSKSALADPDARPKTIVDHEGLGAIGIEWMSGAPAVAIDRIARSVRLADGREIAYDKLLLATGALPRLLPLATNNPHAVYLRTFDEAIALGARLRQRGRVAVIGGGFIGLEIAAAARQQGCAVTVIEFKPRILMRGVPTMLAEAIHDAHVANGTTILAGVDATAIAYRGEASLLSLSNGREVEADLIVVGVGASPAVALAESAGLAIDNGVAVDETLRTSDPNIFAAGDCCSFPSPLYGGRRLRLESWRNAQEQGTYAARNMLGAGEPFVAVPWFWSDQDGLTLQIAGLPDERLRTIRRDLGGGAFILFQLDEDERLVAASGLGRGNTVARDIRLAELLIARRAKPSPERLAAPEVKLKALLAASETAS